MTRRREMLIAILAVCGVLAAVVITVVAVSGDDEQVPAAAPTTQPPTTTSKPKPKPVTRFPAALVVKIDSVAASRPHTGLGRADAIFVAPVEGGLTRMLAVYWGKRPSAIGPVRSARQTDIELLAQFRKPVLSYSGAASQLKPSLRRSPIMLASPDHTSGAYYRRGTHQQPHNMFVNPSRLPETKAVEAPFRTGSAPKGGSAAGSYRVGYRSASYDFTWSKKDKRWLVSQYGTPLTTTEAGRLSAGTVIVQRVKIVRGLGIPDAAGNLSPVAKTKGKGSAVVLRDGKRYQASWSRPNAKKTTVYRVGGQTLRYAPGKVWVLLVPA